MSTPANFKFRLYVAGDSPNSQRAAANLTAICDAHQAERHEIEVVDVLREPERALADLVILTPLLVRLLPEPVLQITGTLSQRSTVLEALGLPVQ